MAPKRDVRAILFPRVKSSQVKSSEVKSSRGATHSHSEHVFSLSFKINS